MILVGIHIADIHINPNNYNRIYEELDKCFLDKIRRANKLDYITINGDLFDYILSLNSRASNTVLNFMNELIYLGKTKCFKIRIIKGTKFHDNDQLRNFQKYEVRNDIDFRIIEKVEVEYLFPDFKVLYLPEEYVEDTNEYYGEYFKDKYNLICGHGMFSEVSFLANKQTSAVTMKKAPIFDSKTFEIMAEGPCIFGHIHTPTVIRDFIYYIGSFSRLCFGEEERKGFTISAYDTDTKKYIVEFIENINAPKYDTIILHNSGEIDVVPYIKDIESKIIDYLRLEIYNYCSKEEIDNIEIIRSYFSKNNKVTIKINNISSEKEKDEKATLELKSKYDFLHDDGIEFPDKVIKFIQMTKDVTINKDRLLNHLSK